MSKEYSQPNVPLAKPPLPHNVIHKLEEVIKSGRLVRGPYGLDFEQAIAEKIEVNHAVAMASGTLAEWVLLKALNIPEGAKVAVPAFTFIGVANAVVFAGGTPVPVDIRSSDLAIDPSLLRQVAEEEDLWGAIVVDPFGFAVDFSPYESIAKEHDLVLIEDAACALGSHSAQNKAAGSRGSGAIFSFHPRKLVTTGEGGMVTTQSDEVARALRELVNHGMNPETGDFDEIGFNARLSELASVCGLASVQNLEREIDQRSLCFQHYKKELQSWEDQGLIRLVDPPEASRWNFQTLILEITTPELGIETLRYNAKSQGIELGGTAQCWPMAKAYSSLQASHHPVATQMEKNTLSLPLYGGLELNDVNRVCSVISKTLEDLHRNTKKAGNLS